MSICGFAGHSQVEDEEEIFEKLYKECLYLAVEKGVTEFMVGNYGIFDRLARNAVKRVKQMLPNIKIYLVLPYLTREITEYREYYEKNYDEIIIGSSPDVKPKYKIISCNKFMAEKSDYMICYCNATRKTQKKTSKLRILYFSRFACLFLCIIQFEN